MSESTEAELRSKILSLVEEYYHVRHAPESFIPGETTVRIGGRNFDQDELVNLVGASLDFWLTEGPYSNQFCAAFSKMMGVKYTILTNSGSSANLLAFSSLLSPNLGDRRMKPGDEVITVAPAFPTTVNPIIQNQCIPVFVDITIDTYNIDVSQLEAALSPRTRAIFVAHTLGNPFDLDAVMEFAKLHDLFVIEDTCDALDSTYNGKLVGTFGDLSTYSFYPPHHMTMGEGGAVITNNSRLFRAVTSLRNWGRDCWCMPGFDDTCRKRFGWQMGDLPKGYDHKYTFTHIGYNLKMLDLQAAIGLAQMEKLPGFTDARRQNFVKLYDRFKEFEEFFHLPQATKGSDPSWFGFALTIRESAPFSRSEIIDYLENRKIMTRTMFTGNILRQPAYQNIERRVIGSLPQTEIVANQTFWVGLYGGINDEMIDYMTEVFANFLRQW